MLRSMPQPCDKLNLVGLQNLRPPMVAAMEQQTDLKGLDIRHHDHDYPRFPLYRFRP